ncbi:MAG: DUF3108 domain-containing protein [Bacteroidales bacterium]
MKNTAAIIVFILSMIFGNHSTAQCLKTDHSFQPGEKVYYEVTYNWGYMWVNAGEVYFKVELDSMDGRPIYKFESYGTSHPFYDWFYKVRDLFQSKVDVEDFHPLSFIRNNSEGGNRVDNSYIFDQNNSKIYSSVDIGGQPFKSDTLELLPCSFDVLSAVYYARTIDYSKYYPGDTIPFRVIINGEYHDLYIRYLGSELKENRDGKKYDCIKFRALLVEGTMFKGGEDLIVWVTNDRNRIPIMVEAKIKIGSIKAYLKTYENLKFELEELDGD